MAVEENYQTVSAPRVAGDAVVGLQAGSADCNTGHDPHWQGVVMKGVHGRHHALKVGRKTQQRRETDGTDKHIH